MVEAVAGKPDRDFRCGPGERNGRGRAAAAGGPDSAPNYGDYIQ